jgi:hypothetical protein
LRRQGVRVRIWSHRRHCRRESPNSCLRFYVEKLFVVEAISLRVAVGGRVCSGVPTFVVSVNFAHICRLLVLYRVEIEKDDRNREQTG